MPITDPNTAEPAMPELANAIRDWGKALGFQQIGITDIELGPHREHLRRWLAQQFHGEMSYMERHRELRDDPAALLPGTLRVISARMDYLPGDDQPLQVLEDASKGYVSRYALGRDYHKLMRRRLAQLAERINQYCGHHSRAFVDSAPVLERAFAEKAGLGWIGKNTMLINSEAGSWFFLGEIFTDLPLPVDPPQASSHCGSCHACLDICPTGAIVGPQQVDARRCISYLTIELRGSIPVELRPLIGNRIYGCDDCQLVCPWNKFAQLSAEADFQARHPLQAPDLLELLDWSEAEFLQRTEGSAIRRIGYACWQRNIAVALGNAPRSGKIIERLSTKMEECTEPMVREHLGWALTQQQQHAIT